MSILDTNVIDVIGVDPEKGIARLGISDHLEWSVGEVEHLSLLQDKINSYLRFLESGEIYEHYPDARHCHCEIELIAKYPLSQSAINFVSEAKKIITDAGFGLSYKVVSAGD
ncbi:DUF6572 domain-containing protein [Burkholderia stagnalis]